MKNQTTKMLAACFTLVIAMAIAQSALAQSASSSLFPFEFVTINPAAMQWGPPSRVGASYSENEVTYDPVEKKRKTGSTSAGARLVWDNFALAGEGSSTETLSTNNLDTSGETGAGAVSFRLFDWISIGGGYQQGTAKSVDSGGSGFEIDYTVAMAGLSLRIGETLFLGYAEGEQELEFAFLPSGTTDTATRGTRTYGAALHMGTDIRMRIEASRTEFDDIILFQSTFGGESNESVSLEIGMGEFMVGGSVSESHNRDNHKTAESALAFIGWVPTEGIALAAAYGESETADNTGTTVEKAEIQAVALAIQF